MAYSPYEHTNTDQPLQTPPFSCGDHQPRRVAVLPLLPQLSRCRRIDEGTWRSSHVRSRAVLVSEIRTDIRQPVTASTSRPGDKWHLDEVVLTLNKVRHYLWRAVDQDGNVLDILVQRYRNKAAAKKFFRKLLKGCQYVPRVLITDQLKSYGAAKRELLSGVEHRQHRYLNNRAENSHQPTRQRERRMQGFKSSGHAQRFLSAYGPIAQHFRPRRHLLPASAYRQAMRQRFHTWQELTNLHTAA
jgi:transposase-like protein